MNRAWRGYKDERGLVSLIVVSVIIVLLALITLGFSRIMDRELRQSLDQDLTTQAYYAAESGLNDARAYINAIKDNPPLINPNQCLSPLPTPYFAANGNISGDNNVKYSCVLIDLNPQELVYDVKGGQTATFAAQSQGNNVAPGNLYFSWENSYYPDQGQPKQPLGSFPQLPQESSLQPNSTGLLRVSIYPVFGDNRYGGNTDNQLAADSRTYFLYANGGNGTVGTIAYASNGSVVPGNCNDAVHPNLPFANATKRYCNAEITGLPAAAKFVYVTVTSVYRDLSISVQGTNPGNSQVVRFGGAEATVDVTGEGNDVLKRLRAHIPYNNDYSYPSGPMTSMQTICKRFRVPKINGPSDSPSNFDSAFPEAGDPACSF